MKAKMIKVMVVLSLLLVWLPTTTIEAKEKPILGVSTVYVNNKTTADIAVYLQSDEKIAAGSFDVTYDTALATVSNSYVAAGEALSGYSLTSINGATAGKVSAAFVSSTGVAAKGNVVTFKASGMKAGATVDFKVENVELYGEDGKKIAVTIVDGGVKPFDGKETKHDGNVANSKPWTVTLSSPYNRASLNEHSVSVKNSRGALVEIEIVAVNKTQFTIKPKGTYARGTYTLEVTDQLLSASGEKLTEPVQHSFTVQ